MNERQFYVDMKDAGRNVKPSYYFMMNCILYSRIETGLESNAEGYDEDVNVYLAHLLESFSHPEYVESARRFLSKYDVEVFERLANSSDARLKYLIYKTNADFMLVSVGVFEQSPAVNQKKFPPAEDASIGRGKAYYQFAYTYSQQLHKRGAAISEVLEKLSAGFEKYVKILSHLRGEYFDLGSRFSSGEFYHLERSVDEEARRQQLRERQDRFLELYSEWRRTGDDELKAALQRQADEIRQLKPDFKFSPR
jgi:hypothetical protein